MIVSPEDETSNQQLKEEEQLEDRPKPIEGFFAENDEPEVGLLNRKTKIIIKRKKKQKREEDQILQSKCCYVEIQQKWIKYALTMMFTTTFRTPLLKYNQNFTVNRIIVSRKNALPK